MGKSGVDHQPELERPVKSQWFFMGGAPRSGTTWLTHLLDSHPDIRCGGEALFNKYLAEPMQKLIAEWARAVDGKNNNLFRETGGVPPPRPQQQEMLVCTPPLHAPRSLPRLPVLPGPPAAEPAQHV